jgi:hypothetical protein
VKLTALPQEQAPWRRHHSCAEDAREQPTAGALRKLAKALEAFSHRLHKLEPLREKLAKALQLAEEGTDWDLAELQLAAAAFFAAPAKQTKLSSKARPS